MFGFKRKVNEEFKKVYEEIYKIKYFKKKIENAIPTFNKLIEKQKKLEELCAKLLQVTVKMDKKIKNQKDNTTNYKKKGK